MSRNVKVVLAVLPFIAFVSGCAQPPTDRMETARKEMESLAQDARTYAPDTYETASRRAAELNAEIEAQEESTFPSYDLSNDLLLSLEASIAEVRETIAESRERLRTETTGLVADIRRQTADAREALSTLPAQAVPQNQRAAWGSDLQEVETSLTNVDRLLSEARFSEAQQEARTALEAAQRVNTSVSDVEADQLAASEAAAERAKRGEVTIPRPVLADGKPLPPNTYQVRLGSEQAPEDGPAPAGRWLEFVRDGTVAGRSLAVVVPADKIGDIAKSPVPQNAARVDVLRSGHYVRVWVNRDGINYLIHLPVQS